MKIDLSWRMVEYGMVLYVSNEGERNEQTVTDKREKIQIEIELGWAYLATFLKALFIMMIV